MGGKRQKNQMLLAFMLESRGEAPMAGMGGTEPPAAKREPESPAEDERLMEEVCNRENLWKALRQVQSNKGSPGVDGMTVRQLPGYLKEQWPAIREQLLRGAYKPQPVKRVEIPKPDGGVRKLGIPTVGHRKAAPCHRCSRTWCWMNWTGSWRSGVIGLPAMRTTATFTFAASEPAGG